MRLYLLEFACRGSFAPGKHFDNETWLLLLLLLSHDGTQLEPWPFLIVFPILANSRSTYAISYFIAKPLSSQDNAAKRGQRSILLTGFESAIPVP